MAERSGLLTTRDMQDLLQIDRSTIYRMAESGEIPALKVGKQWRFQAAEVEKWLNASLASSQSTVPSLPLDSDRDFASLIPLECLQLIQDAFAEVMGAQLIITRMDGTPITHVSNPCPLFELLAEHDQTHTICREKWQELGQAPNLEPEFIPSLGGLLCARAFVRIGNQLKAMVIIFGVAPEKWTPGREVTEQISELVEIPANELENTLNTVFILSTEQKEKVLVTIRRIAEILSHVGSERSSLLDRLDSIAALSTT